MSQEADILSRVLAHVRASTSIFSRAKLSGQWGVSTHALPTAIFHVVTQGKAYVKLHNAAEHYLLAKGDIVLISTGSAHDILSEPGAQTTPLTSLRREETRPGCSTVYAGNGGEETNLLCGSIKIQAHGLPLVLMTLPEVLVVHDSTGACWLDTTVASILNELDASERGQNALSNRLAEILIVKVLRQSVSNATQGFLAALRDDGLAKALSEFFYEPSRSWKIEELAKLSGMSRSAFQRKFTAALGQSPAAYTRAWRLYLATQTIRDGGTVEQAAVQTGYSSANALAQAFRQQYGRSPASFRADN
jgi:AraC-like DNA-binding protein